MRRKNNQELLNFFEEIGASIRHLHPYCFVMLVNAFGS